MEKLVKFSWNAMSELGISAGSCIWVRHPHYLQRVEESDIEKRTRVN